MTGVKLLDIKNLVNKTLQTLYIFVGELQQIMLFGCEIAGIGELAHRGSYERERGAEVVADVGEES